MKKGSICLVLLGMLFLLSPLSGYAQEAYDKLGTILGSDEKSVLESIRNGDFKNLFGSEIGGNGKGAISIGAIWFESPFRSKFPGIKPSSTDTNVLNDSLRDSIGRLKQLMPREESNNLIDKLVTKYTKSYKVSHPSNPLGGSAGPQVTATLRFLCDKSADTSKLMIVEIMCEDKIIMNDILKFFNKHFGKSTRENNNLLWKKDNTYAFCATRARNMIYLYDADLYHENYDDAQALQKSLLKKVEEIKKN
ncbi:MAG: hypothetical protein J1E80_07210 [Desulfovibrionaceae bacterium]|nr:hypothetical protein [Desulfovibrionaceae bacterium]